MALTMPSSIGYCAAVEIEESESNEEHQEHRYEMDAVASAGTPETRRPKHADARHRPEARTNGSGGLRARVLGEHFASTHQPEAVQPPTFMMNGRMPLWPSARTHTAHFRESSDVSDLHFFPRR